MANKVRRRPLPTAGVERRALPWASEAGVGPAGGARTSAATRREFLLRFGIVAAGAALGGAASARDLTPLTFDQFYKSIGVRGLQFSDMLLALRGQPVVIHGYMAPPLKAESKFFVLTREPMAICPFCQSDADWPADIVVVYLDRATPLFGGGQPVVVRGRLDVGSAIDPETGFVSQIRVVDAVVHRQ